MDYIHQYIAAKNGVTVPIKETNPSKAANVKYLLCAIDKANELSAASTNTSYCSNALATTQVVDTIAVADASNRLFNCNAGGYYKAGGATSCSDCGVGYYCPVNGNTRTVCTFGAVGCSGVNHTTNVNPYVTNGLIMQFDGIANNSAGGHTSGALSSWYDMTGNGYNFASWRGAVASANATGIVMNALGQTYRTVKTINMTSFSNVTVEIRAKTTTLSRAVWLFEFGQDWNSVKGSFGALANSGGSMTYTANSIHTNQKTTAVNGARRDYTAASDTALSHTHSNVWSFNSADATGRMSYFDGKSAASSDSSAVWGESSTDYFYLGGRGITASDTAGVEVYSFRVYNRKLTAAEVCQNAKADYARFGGAVPSC